MPKLLVIDPGHDLDDPGSTQYDGEPERVYTLALARAVRTALLHGWDCAVALTHGGLVWLPAIDPPTVVVE